MRLSRHAVLDALPCLYVSCWVLVAVYMSHNCLCVQPWPSLCCLVTFPGRHQALMCTSSQVPVGGDPRVVPAHVAGQPGCRLLRLQLANLQVGLCTQLQVGMAAFQICTPGFKAALPLRAWRTRGCAIARLQLPIFLGSILAISQQLLYWDLQSQMAFHMSSRLQAVHFWTPS